MVGQVALANLPLCNLILSWLTFCMQFCDIQYCPSPPLLERHFSQFVITKSLILWACPNTFELDCKLISASNVVFNLKFQICMTSSSIKSLPKMIGLSKLSTTRNLVGKAIPSKSILVLQQPRPRKGTTEAFQLDITFQQI